MDLGFLLKFVAAAAVAAVSWAAWSAAEWSWLRPRWLERKLSAQGIGGSRYRFPYGDLRDARNLALKVCRKPMPLSHCIVDRVLPQLKRALDLGEGKNKMSIFWFGPYPRVIVMDPELVKDILYNKFGHFERPRPMSIGKLLIMGLATYNGEKWAKHRRIINPAFHVEKLKMMIPAFSTCCDELIDRWENLAGKAGVFEIDVFSEFQNFAGDVISRAAFGSSYKEGRRIFELQMEQTELVLQVDQTLYIPGFRFIPTKMNRRRNEIYKEVGALLKNLVEKREVAMRSGESNTNDLLGLLMESNQMYSKEQGGHLQDASLTTDEVIQECKLFYFAGQETTSALLTWTMILLSMHPKWQDQVTMILYEVLRLYPPGTILLRQTYKEIKLGEFTLPPGVQLLIPITLIHHSKEFWGDDAEEFNPERFAEGISNATKNRLIFFPFSWGPRICIGQSFALAEAKMALARILQRFSFELSPSYAHAPYIVITLQPQYGAQLILHKL